MKEWNLHYEVKALFKVLEPEIFDNIRFYVKDNDFFCELNVWAINLDEAIKEGFQNLLIVRSAMIFSLGLSLDFELKEVIEVSSDVVLKEGTTFHPASLSIRERLTQDKTDDIRRLLELINQDDKTANSAIYFYIRGVEIHKWNIETFINYFKCIELIADKFLQEYIEEKKTENKSNSERLIAELRNLIIDTEVDDENIKEHVKKIYKIELVHLKLKVKNTLNKFNLSEYAVVMNKMVDLRSSVAAHGSTSTIIKDEQVKQLQKVAKELILKYIHWIDNS